MEQLRDYQSNSINQQPHDWAKLICKLRWIGMEEEACRLQTAVCSLRPEESPRPRPLIERVRSGQRTAHSLLPQLPKDAGG